MDTEKDCDISGLVVKWSQQKTGRTQEKPTGSKSCVLFFFLHVWIEDFFIRLSAALTAENKCLHLVSKRLQVFFRRVWANSLHVFLTPCNEKQEKNRTFFFRKYAWTWWNISPSLFQLRPKNKSLTDEKGQEFGIKTKSTWCPSGGFIGAASSLDLPADGD